jgi:catechol 2,3-dioxygenase-like lactoylglutathione lyase family enzyme
MPQANDAASAAMVSVSPFFIVRDVEQSLAFYRDRLGFDVTYLAPRDSPFFAIVRRGGAQLLLKAVDESVGPLPNCERHPWARWDAYVHVSDPDSLARELAGRDVEFSVSLADTDDGLRGFELKDRDGYTLFFGRPS